MSLGRRLENEWRRRWHSKDRSLIRYRAGKWQRVPLRTIDDTVPFIKGNLAFIIIVTLDLTFLLCGPIRWFNLGRAFLARALPRSGTLVRTSPLGLSVILAFVASANAVIALRSCGVATNLASTTDMPTNSGLSQ